MEALRASGMGFGHIAAQLTLTRRKRFNSLARSIGRVRKANRRGPAFPAAATAAKGMRGDGRFGYGLLRI
jgi:hypothetical protein